MAAKFGIPFYDQQFALVDADIRRMKKGDGRARKIGLKRLTKITKQSELDMIILGAKRAIHLKRFIERTKPIFRMSYSYEFWAEGLMRGKSINHALVYG